MRRWGRIWLDHCPNLPDPPLLAKSKFPPDHSTQSGDRGDRAEWVIRSVNVTLIHYQVRIQHNFVTLVTPAAANTALFYVLLFLHISTLIISRVWCIINSSLKCEGCDGMQEKATGHSGLGDAAKLGRSEMMLWLLLLLLSSPTATNSRVLGGGWWIVNECNVWRERGQCVVSWPLPLIRNQGYFCGGLVLASFIYLLFWRFRNNGAVRCLHDILH